MKLGLTEWWLMNNPVRALSQRYFEVPQLLRIGGVRPQAIALEIGCGNGSGVDLLRNRFNVRQVHAFDVDPRMVRLASAKHRRRPDELALWVGNVRQVPVTDARYDAVFDFGILHHVVNWPAALVEIHRVLKPGGRFYIEEISRQFIVHPIWRRLLDHPQENRFDREEFMAALESTGFTVRRCHEWGGLFIWCIADKKN